MIGTFRKLIREPLFHFVILGAIIFIVYSTFVKVDPTPDTIFITKGDVISLEAGFVRTRQRPPTKEELEGLIREQIRQEVYRREAVALGLDKDDIIIQRRLQQKLEFIIGDNVAAVTPTDVELQDYYKNHSDQFKNEPQYSFRQVFLDPEKHGNSIEKDALKILSELNRGNVDFEKLSDPTLLPFDLKDARVTEISGGFGNEFIPQLAQLQIGKWEGPVKSAYGLHLVLIIERKEAIVPALSEIREDVVREWNNFKVQEANEKIFQELLKNYKITFEK
jgi:hypothetical protein